MARAQCKDEAHDGDTAWVDREDALLVRRSVGGAYNRAARMQDSLICVACASRILAHLREQGGARGHRLHNRWSISGLEVAYAQFRRSRGLMPKVEEPTKHPSFQPPAEAREESEADPMQGEALTQEQWFGDDLPKERDQEVNGRWLPEGTDTRGITLTPEQYQALAARDPHMQGIRRAISHAEEAQAKARLVRTPTDAYGGLVPRKPGEFHHHIEIGVGYVRCVFCGGTTGEPCRGPQADEWDARMQARRDLKDKLFRLVYGSDPMGQAVAADEMAEFNAETLRLFPDRFREPTPEEQARREEFARLMEAAPVMHVSTPMSDMVARWLSDPPPRSYDVMPIAHLRPPVAEEPTSLKDWLKEWSKRELGIDLDSEQFARMEQSLPDLQQKPPFSGKDDLAEREVRRLLDPPTMPPLTPAEEAYLAKARRQQDEFNEQIRKAKETAWAEGWNGARIHQMARHENPYRKAD